MSSDPIVIMLIGTKTSPVICVTNAPLIIKRVDTRSSDKPNVRIIPNPILLVKVIFSSSFIIA